MRKIVAALAALVAVAAIAPSVASADYYTTKSRAESFTRDAFHKRYDDSNGHMIYGCRPQGAMRAKPGYVYHRWTCVWADRYYEGEFVIAGSSRGPWAYSVVAVPEAPTRY